MPRVSVIIPAYNAEATIAETLRSVEAQTFRDWEVVVVDDCSTDRTVEVAQAFGDRFKVIRAIENGGPAAARNLAIASSTSELLAFLDSDDYWLPEYLDRQVSAFDDAAGPVGIVACDARVLGVDGFLADSYLEIAGSPDVVTTAVLLKKNPIFVSALATRRVVDEAGGFDAEIFGVEDRDLWLKIVERGHRVVVQRLPLAVYRLAPQSVSANPASMARATQLFYRRALERGNLDAHERRIAQRELRLQRVIEQVASEDGISMGRLARALPLLARVAAEHPNRWPSYAQMVARRKLRFSSFPG